MLWYYIHQIWWNFDQIHQTWWKLQCFQTKYLYLFYQILWFLGVIQFVISLVKIFSPNMVKTGVIHFSCWQKNHKILWKYLGENLWICRWKYFHQIRWKWEGFTKIVDKNFTKVGDFFGESPNLVMILSPSTLGLLGIPRYTWQALSVRCVFSNLCLRKRISQGSRLREVRWGIGQAVGARKLEMGRAPMQYRRTNVQKCYTGHKQCTQCAHTMQCAHTIKYNSGCEHKYGNCTVYSFFYTKGRFMASWALDSCAPGPNCPGTKEDKICQSWPTYANVPIEPVQNSASARVKLIHRVHSAHLPVSNSNAHKYENTSLILM